MTVPNYPNGVTHDMAEAGAEAFTRAGYAGVAYGSVEEGRPHVPDTPTAIGIALSRAFPAMADRMEGGPRDALLHPGPIGGGDLAGWHGMLPKHRAQHVHHQAPAYLLGVASALHGQRHPLGTPSQSAALGFLRGRTQSRQTTAEEVGQGAEGRCVVTTTQRAPTRHRPRPQGLDEPGLYGLEVDGDCMVPRLRHGQTGIFSPTRPCKPGDVVALIFTDGGPPCVKELVSLPPVPLGRAPAAGSTGEFAVMVRSINPPRVYTIRASSVAAVHRLVGVYTEEAGAGAEVLP